MIQWMLDPVLDWLAEHRTVSKIATYAIVYGLVMGVALAGYGLVEWAQPVQAAPSGPCATVATVKGIEFYYCEPDDAPPFLANSMGFMTPVE